MQENQYHSVKSVQIRGYFWSVCSCIRTEYRKRRTRHNSVFAHFSRSEFLHILCCERYRSWSLFHRSESLLILSYLLAVIMETISQMIRKISYSQKRNQPIKALKKTLGNTNKRPMEGKKTVLRKVTLMSKHIAAVGNKTTD